MMKSALVFAVALLGVASADTNSTRDAIIAFTNCVNKALDGGLPSAHIPDHNPLSIPRTISLPLIGNDSVTIHDILMHNVTIFEIRSVEIQEASEERLTFTYELYWPNLAFTGLWDAKVLTGDLSGTWEINQQHLHFNGVWNMTMAGGDRDQNLDDFTILISAETVPVTITGLGGGIIEGLVNGAATAIMTPFVNNVPTEVLYEGLRQRMNTLWIDDPARLDAILANCQ